jgi:hypothetical protein
MAARPQSRITHQHHAAVVHDQLAVRRRRELHYKLTCVAAAAAMSSSPCTARTSLTLAVLTLDPAWQLWVCDDQ